MTQESTQQTVELEAWVKQPSVDIAEDPAPAARFREQLAVPASKTAPMSAHAQKQMDELLTVKAKATYSISIAAELECSVYLLQTMFNMVEDLNCHGAERKFLFLTNVQAQVCLVQILSISGMSLLLCCRYLI